jgi:hypothetical protein
MRDTCSPAADRHSVHAVAPASARSLGADLLGSPQNAGLSGVGPVLYGPGGNDAFRPPADARPWNVDQKSPPFQPLSGQHARKYAPSRPAHRTRQEQRASTRAGEGPPRSPSRIVVVGNQRGAPVVHPPGGRGPRDVWPQARGGSGNDARVVRVPSPGAAYGVCTEHLAGRDGHAGTPHLGDDRGGGRASIATA